KRGSTWTFQERTLMGRSDVWHKIKVVRGTQYDKETVLKSILAAIEPADMIPVQYQASGEDTIFLARNCAHALDKLCKTSLIIKNPDGDPLLLIITLGFASVHDIKINMQPLLRTALEARYNATKKSLNLEQFRRDPEMSKTIYSPLSQPKVFSYVLKLAKSSIGTVEHLNLQKNELYSLTAMNGLNLSIKYLDLRHNNLMNMDVLSPLKGTHITKLWLDGNPLCENYCKPQRYIDSALKYCPNLAELDGVHIGTSELMRSYTNYFKDESREELVTKFVHHFFNLYDHNDRASLRGLYHPNAFYSMSFGIAHALAHKRKLTQFTASRNLMKNVDATKKRQHLYYGQDNVLASLKRLPKSYHDKNSFVLDLLYDDGKCLTINVSGIFKNSFNTSQILWFSRTFIIQASPNNCEYNILNDQYYVDATMEEIPASSIDSQIPYDELPTIASCFSKFEKQEMLEKLAEVTTLNDDWCRTYLEESKWDLRKAITNFMKDYSSSSIPSNAF
ncbi:nuclear RNA export factor 1-like, partial [Ceratina calcarata]|uniref:Nuclear RNA export factor 1-like n=1 Tax=Ceratina calcarata TaxID=156304 RepID=A0AAJ7JDW8_9HYME